MRTLDGKKIKVTRAATRELTWKLDGQPITRDRATGICYDEIKRINGSIVAACYMRDIRALHEGVQTAEGLLTAEWRDIAQTDNR